MRSNNPGVVVKKQSMLIKLYLMKPILKLLLAVFLFFIICIIGFSFIKDQSNKQYLILKQKQSALETDVSLGASSNGQMEYLSKNMTVAKQQYETIIKEFPSESQVGDLLASITKLGTKEGLKFVSFKPGAAINHGYYAEVPVNISVTGQFHQIARFLSGVANLPGSVVAVNEFTINHTKDQNNLLSLEFIATLYYTLPTSMDFNV